MSAARAAMKPGVLEATVSKIVPEGTDARLLRLELPEGRVLDFRPGQFVEVSLPGSELPARHYSIANPPSDPGAVEILFDRHGPLSEALFRLSGGEPVLVRGPLGRWAYSDEDRRSVLVSTGTGVAPLRAMVRYALEKGLPNRIELFFSAPTPGRLYFRREMEEWAERGIGVHLSVTGAEGLWEDGQWWDGPREALSAEALRAALGSFAGAAFYVCGSGRLVSELSGGLAAAGVPESALRLAPWGDY